MRISDIISYFRGDPVLVEMANLRERETGVSGIIYISTSQGSHGPRVKYYPGGVRGGPMISVTVTENPKLKVVSKMKRSEAVQYTKKISQWITINRDALLDFWQNGVDYDRDAMNAFYDRILPVE